MDFALAKAFIQHEIWVEAVSNQSIAWDETVGWNFYYRISGSLYCEWHLFLYNHQSKRCCYRNAYSEGQCHGAELRLTHKISENLFMYDLSEVPEAAAPQTNEDR